MNVYNCVSCLTYFPGNGKTILYVWRENWGKKPAENPALEQSNFCWKNERKPNAKGHNNKSVTEEEENFCQLK